MLRSLRSLRSIVCLTALCAPAASLAQGSESVTPGPNVNMVSGDTWPDGDPFLQRQNEPSGLLLLLFLLLT